MKRVGVGVGAPPAPLELVAESFEYVHQAAWDQRLSDSAWGHVPQ
jgi:hypothetical protein